MALKVSLNSNFVLPSLKLEFHDGTVVDMLDDDLRSPGLNPHTVMEESNLSNLGPLILIYLTGSL